MNKSYSELILLPTYQERLEYLKTNSVVGRPTFGTLRYLNQKFYTSRVWTNFKAEMIYRDEGCDLGIKGLDIHDSIILHHINEVTIQDMLDFNPIVLDPNNVICTCLNTHNQIHYGKQSDLPIERTRNDMCPWLK